MWTAICRRETNVSVNRLEILYFTIILCVCMKFIYFIPLPQEESRVNAPLYVYITVTGCFLADKKLFLA
jgi:hypothetical protein